MIKMFLCMFVLLIATPAIAQERYSAIVMDARTNEILHNDNIHEIRQPASLTKMMTLYLIFEALEEDRISLDTRWTASRNATRQPPTRLGLRCRRRACDSITVEQAIRALVVQSANDVATLAAEQLGGSEARFAAMMSHQARELDMADTTFGNASGLPSNGNRTTAYDMALLSIALWRDFPAYYHFFSIESNRGVRNHNRLLGQIEGMDGLKTGYIRASGFNLATMTERNGVRFVVVVLGGASAASRDAQVAYLTESAFNLTSQYGNISLPMPEHECASPAGHCQYIPTLGPDPPE